MSALSFVGAGFVLGWLSLAILGWVRDEIALRRTRRNRLELPGDRVWPPRSRR